jgi:5-methylcytosine-specific restriction endonuclease McrA
MKKLTIELVPSTSWYTNVRSNVSKSEWDKIRKKCYAAASHKCEICGGKGRKHPVECHEVWDYDDKLKVQKLTSLVSLCPSCHQVKHAGLSIMRGLERDVIFQLMAVNKYTRADAIKDIQDAFEVYHKRSDSTWDVNINYIKEYMNEA